MNTAADIAKALGGTKSGAGWMAKCPAHKDQKPSLSINEGADGKLLVHCHTGCSQTKVVDALKAKGLWLTDPKKPTAERIQKLVATYDYTDEDGVLLYQVLRYDPKTFKQRRPDGKGYKWNMQGVKRVPYRLCQLLAAIKDGKTIFIVEGEKDADALTALGLVATTNPGGAGKWQPELSARFAGAIVCILPDNDEAGRAHAANVAEKLKSTAKVVAILELPGLPHKGDVSDWIAVGGTLETLSELVETALKRPYEPVSSLTSTSLDATGTNLDLVRKRCGEPIANLDNAVRILEQCADLTGFHIYYDEVAARVMRISHEGEIREWADDDDISLALYCQRDVGVRHMSPQIVSQAVQTMARRDTRNPIDSYLDQLGWDGTSRIGNFLRKAFGVKKSRYTRVVSKNLLLSMVARAYIPGCKVDTMVVLEGPQGIGKSQGIAALGGAFFAESSEHPSSKDFYVALAGKWLVEVSELDSFSRADVTAVKRTLSCCVDRYRPPYGRASVDHPRRCIFVATTNRDDWQRDETGARRFWPVRVTRVDLTYIRDYRDQLFAEAVHRYKQGESWWEVPEATARAEQEARRSVDPWEVDIASWVKGQSSVTINALLSYLGIDTGKRTKVDQMRVASCLRVLGWKKVDGKLDGTKCKYWVKAR